MLLGVFCYTQGNAFGNLNTWIRIVLVSSAENIIINSLAHLFVRLGTNEQVGIKHSAPSFEGSFPLLA